jgi:hypothetical protein
MSTDNDDQMAEIARQLGRIADNLDKIVNKVDLVALNVELSAGAIVAALEEVRNP